MGDIEVKQGELERQGVKLEKTIREICVRNDAEEGANRDSLGPEAEDLIIQLFDLVNEKNELFRRQTELIYMKKENRLEEQYGDCEYQIRVIMSKPECQRTEEDNEKDVDTSELDNLEAKPEKPKKKSAKKKILNLASKGLASSKQLAFPHKN